MIVETQLKGLDNKPIKVNKKSPPRSVNSDLTSLYFTAMFIGAKNSGKSYGLVKLLKNYEAEPIKDYQGNTLPIRTILFCPTANSAANPIFNSLKSLSEDDIILNYSDDLLLDKIEEIANDKQEIEEYSNYVKAYNKFVKTEDTTKLDDEELLLLNKYGFNEPETLKQPKYKYPPVIFLILDDLIGSNDCFKRGNCTISNLTIKHRHLGINMIFTSQNPKSIPNIIRNNVDIFCLYKFANTKMVLEKLYDEVSSFLTEEEFEAVYKYATLEPHNCLYIDTHPTTHKDKRLRRNFDVLLSIVVGHQAIN
jgi:hypothetical protein